MQAVDELLWKWDAAYGKLQAAEAAFEASGCKCRPTHHLKRLRCRGLRSLALSGHTENHDPSSRARWLLLWSINKVCKHVSLGGKYCTGEVDSIDFWASRVRQLESAISKEQDNILKGDRRCPICLSLSQFSISLLNRSSLHPYLHALRLWTLHI